MDTLQVPSLNFDFLGHAAPDLAALGMFAENYARTDRPSALVKLRAMTERMVRGLYRMMRRVLSPARGCF